jgi:hypothetical protein
MLIQPLEKPTWRTGLKKRIRAVPLSQRYDMLFVGILLLLQASLFVLGMISIP